MSKFKVGDLVRVREDLVSGRKYSWVLFAPEMEQYKGFMFEVLKVTPTGRYYLGIGNRFLKQKSFNMAWLWSDDMLEPYIPSYETASDDEINSLLF